MEILGIEERSGVYEGRNYHNYNLYCSSLCTVQENGFAAGKKTFKYKVKATVLKEFMDDSGYDIDYLIGVSVRFLFNQYNQVERIEEVK